MKALLINNPKAGRPKSNPQLEIQEVFRAQSDFELENYQTTGPGDATVAARQAAAEGYDLVIAAGGDGSIFEVANGLIDTQASLGVIPVGTENVLAREMGIPLSVRKSCEHLLKTPPRIIDTGKIENQHFVCFAGIGFDAHVAHRLPSRRKARLGALAYFLTSAQLAPSYKKAPHRLKITNGQDSKEMDFFVALVSNIRTYGGGLVPAPDASVSDGLLDVCIFPRANLINVMRHLAAATQGKHVHYPGVEYFQAQKVVIETEPDEQLQLDGDAWPGSPPYTIEVAAQSLKVRF